MELRELEALLAVADERHFTRAAARLHIAQPALSQQIQRLEREVGLQLVDRAPRRVGLTQAGEVLAVRARHALAELDAARSELNDLLGLRAGRVVIGVGRATRSFPLSTLLATYRRTAPEVELVVREGLSPAITQAIRDDEVDLGIITPLGDEAGPGLELQTLSSERLVAILPRGHRLGSRRRLALTDLRDEPFVVFPPEAVIRRRLEREAARHDLALKMPFEVSQLGRLRSLVSAGLGVSLLPLSEARAPGDPVDVVPITGRDLTHQVLLAHRTGRQHGPAVRAFLDAARQTLG